MKRALCLACIVCAALALSGAAVAPPIPRQAGAALTPEEVQALVKRVISNQHQSDATMAEYERRERRQLFRHDDNSRPTEDKTFRVVPTGTGTLRLLVEESGRPVSTDFYRKQLRDLEQALVWALDPADSKQKQRIEKWKRRTRERAEMVDAIGEAFRFSWQGREPANGRILLKLSFEPNPIYKPHSRNTEMFTHIRGTIWVDEAAEQLARVEAEIVTDISIGGGLLGKIYHGGRFRMEQSPATNGTWLPSRYEYNFDGRRFVFGFEVHEITTASSYRRTGPPKETLAAVRQELSTGAAPAPAH